MSCESRLLSLPSELRTYIWDALLAPENEGRALTAVSRTCSSTQSSRRFDAPGIHFRAHELDDTTCACHSRSFYIHSGTASLWPAILQVNKQVYHEALPSLYRRRIFTTDPNRTFTTMWDRSCEVWFLLDHFLQRLSPEAISNIQSIRLPMLLSKFEVLGARHCFYNIASRLPNLHIVEIEFSPSCTREYWNDTNTDMQMVNIHGFSGLHGSDEVYFLGPVMAFADVKIVVTAVDKHDIGQNIFDRLKPAIELRIWSQLLPLRMKKERRKICRIRRALGALEYDEVATNPEVDEVLLVA